MSDDSARWRRERTARKNAERLLEAKSRELFEANEGLRRLNLSLEQRVEARTAEAKRLSIIAARTTNGVILTDAAGRVEWVNEGFQKITGYSLEEMRGRKPGHVLQGPGTNAEDVEYIRRRVAAQLGFRREILNYTKSGRPIWLEVEVQPIWDDKGELQNFMAIESNITERKEVELRQQRVVEGQQIATQLDARLINEEEIDEVIDGLIEDLHAF